MPHNPLPYDPSSYYPPIYAWVLQLASLPQVSPPKPCIYIYSPTRTICPAHPILLDFITRTILGEEKTIELMGKKYEEVESFKYLGSVMTSSNDINMEIKSKLAAGNKCYYTLGPILKRSISQSIKIPVY
jgi:hypothetical protein